MEATKNRIDENIEAVCESELRKKIYRQHVLGCWVAIIAAAVWAILDYYVRFNNYKLLVTDMSITAISIVALIMLKKWKSMNPEILGVIPAMYMFLLAAYLYNSFEYEEFAKYTLNYVAIFVGIGMFFLWRLSYSIIIISIVFAANVITNILYSPLSIQEYLNGGGILTLTMGIFMVISIHARYKMVKKDIRNSIELKNSEEKANQLINTTMDGVITVSSQQKIIMFNPAAETMFGYKAAEVIDKPLEMLIPEGFRKTHPEKVRSFETSKDMTKPMKEGKTVYGRRATGDYFPVETSLSKMKINGEVFFNAIIRDVTIQTQAKKELVEAKQLAENSKEMQARFLSNMSHEIRTPMNGILGITKILQKSDIDNEQQKYLNAIKKSADNLMVIINDILDFSKIEAGKVIIEKTSFNIYERFEVLQNILEIKASEKGIYFEINMEENIPKHIIGDPVRLNQILLNLAGNAMKFTEKGGVTIDVSILNCKNGKLSIQFEVQDTGIGIPEDRIEDIFSSFTQANSNTTRKFGGTGLGLTISKDLIELQGGELKVDSAEGIGSSFKFSLVYEIDAEEKEVDFNDSGKKEQERLIEIGEINILLVEDHDINQMLAIKVLKDWNFNVDLAENGLEAVAMVKKNDYDIVLMDISMPIMDGYTATKRIRDTLPSPKNNIPIVAMTASALIGENEKCFKAGMNDYVPKPFDTDLLLKKIEKNIN